MFTVREEQIEVFERVLFEATQGRIERAIAAVFPELDGHRGPPQIEGDEQAPSALRTIVERGIESAVGVGLADAGDFAAFIALGLALRLSQPGPGTRWIHAWLLRTDMPGQTKLGMIESRLRRLAKRDPALGSIAMRIEKARELTGP